MPSKINDKDSLVTRRQFLTTCGVALGALSGGIYFYSNVPVRPKKEKIFTFKDYTTKDGPTHPLLSIVRGTDAGKMVRAAVDKLGGMSRFVKPGESVLIKPNVGWDRQPELAANTSPEVVGAVVKLCVEAKASHVWVTDVSINDPYRSFARSGIEEAVNHAGGVIKYNGQESFVPTDLKGDVLKIWPVSGFFHEVDKLINVPIAKHHSLSKCTLSMKNLYGSLGGQRNKLHQAIDNSIADLANTIRPTLTIMDAIRVLKQNGPTGGNLSDVGIENTVIAGTDIVAVDSFTLQFLDLTPDKVPFIKLAESKGIGTSSWKDINYVDFQVG